MIERHVNRLRTQQSIRYGYGGDLLRRKFTGDRAQCGCEWRRDDPQALADGVRGDVLWPCVFHAQANQKGGG